MTTPPNQAGNAVNDAGSEADRKTTPLENALLAMQDQSGQISFIYCDQQCHPSDAGVILANHYQSEESIAALIAGGSIRQLQTRPQDCSTYNALMGKPPEPPNTFNGSPRDFFNHYCNRVVNIYLHTPQRGWMLASGREPIPLADAIAWHQAP